MKVFLYDAESDYELQDEELNLEQAITEFYELSDIKGSPASTRLQRVPYSVRNNKLRAI
ncbi:hypothetical protein [Zobellia uliginosa]|uniref:hypothetical protein n=1 Tax=Zobellia uliginosa TaxID=143224 RepID=UPI0026E2BB8F|nr:hypothetical protein [Zobellia uliginosa]MDO6519028.1 hypothetical protein [Zobellia uliginosa]